MAHGKIKRKLAGFVSNISQYIVGVVIGLIFLAICSAFCSCSPCERLSRKCPPIEYVRDSVHVTDTCWFETIVVDTPMVVKLPPEYIYMVRPHHDTVKGETAFTRGLAWVDGESINLTLTNKDSAEVLVQRIKTLERQLRESYREKETDKVREVYKTRRIVKFFAGMGIGALIMLLIRIAVFIARKR